MLTYSRHLYNKVFFPRRKTVAVTSGGLKVLSLRLSFHSNFEAFVLHVFYIGLHSVVLRIVCAQFQQRKAGICIQAL